MPTDTQGRYEGVWWVPSSPSSRFHGLLELNSGHELTIFGSLKSAASAADDLKVVHGHCNGRYITLLECSVRFDLGLLAESGTSTYYAPIVLAGNVDLTDSEIEFDWVEATLGRMNTFAARSGIARTATATTETAYHESLESLVAEFNGTRYALHSEFMEKPTAGGIEWHEREVLEVMLQEAVPIRDILQRVVGPFLSLLHLASGYPAAIDSLRVRRSADSSDGLSPWSDVSIYTGVADPNELRMVRPNEFLLSLADIPFSDLIPRWLTIVEQLGLALDVLFSLDKPQSGFVSSRFFNAAAAAESIHRRLNPDREHPSEKHKLKVARIINRVLGRDRRWVQRQLRYSHRLDFATRMAELIEEARPPFDPYIARQSQWIKVVTRLRNMVAHNLDDDDLERRPAALHRLGSSIDLLLRIVSDLRNRLRIMPLNWHFRNRLVPKSDEVRSGPTPYRRSGRIHHQVHHRRD